MNDMQESSLLQESIYSSDCVSDAIEFVWDRVSSDITEKWLRTLELPIAIEMTILKINKVVGWSVLRHDGILVGQYLEKIEPEAEPVPVIIDPWARGTVPTRKETPANIFVPSSSNAKALSVSSYRSSRSSNARGLNLATCTTGTVTNTDDVNISGKIIELDEESGVKNFEAPASMFRLLQKLKQCNIGQKKSPVDETATDFDVMQRDIGNAAKDLKGKQFVICKDGRLLTLKPIRSESLPAFAVAVNATISESDKGDLAAHKNSKKAHKVIRVAGSPSVSGLYFTGPTQDDHVVGMSQVINCQSGESLPSVPRRVNRKIKSGEENIYKASTAKSLLASTNRSIESCTS